MITKLHKTSAVNNNRGTPKLNLQFINTSSNTVTKGYVLFSYLQPPVHWWFKILINAICPKCPVYQTSLMSHCMLLVYIYLNKDQIKELLWLFPSKNIQQVTQHVAVTVLNSNRGHKQTQLSVILLTQGKICQEKSGCHSDRQLWGIIHLISPTEKTHVKQHTVQLVCLSEESDQHYIYCMQWSKHVCKA